MFRFAQNVPGAPRRARMTDVVPLKAGILGFIIMLTCGLEASGHPHVWITARSEILFSPEGFITAVRHAWTFDDMFSSYALQGVASAKKGVFTRDELAPLALTNVEALKDFDYFTFAKADGRKQKFGDPVDYFFETENDQLVLHFTLPFKNPIKARQLVLEIFDPTYFIAFEMAKSDPVVLNHAPVKCTATLRPPRNDAAMSRKMNEENFLTGDAIGDGALFSSYITVACP